MSAYSIWPRAVVRGAAAAFACGALFCGTVYAMRVSPMVVEMTTTGSGTVARVEVENLNTGDLPFETRINRLDFDERGQPVETPADGDFLVFPPQGVLTKGGRQVVRLQWVGGADIPASRAYYLSVNQLPVQLDSNTGQSAQVQIVYHMKALITVAPPGATPNVSATAIRAIEYQPPAVGKEAPPPRVAGVEVTMKNTGRRYAMMSQFRWLFEGTGKDGKPLKLVVSSEDLNRTVGTGYVAGGGGVRVFQLPLIQAFGAGPITLKFLK